MIRNIKDRVCDIYVALPFDRVPGRLIVELVYFCVFWLKVFHPPKTIVPGTSPQEVVLGKSVNYNKHYKFEFCQYVQTHEDHDNSMQTRTFGALFLRPILETSREATISSALSLVAVLIVTMLQSFQWPKMLLTACTILHIKNQKVSISKTIIKPIFSMKLMNLSKHHQITYPGRVQIQRCFW